MAKRKSNNTETKVKCQAWCRHCGFIGEAQPTARRGDARANEHANSSPCGGGDIYTIPVVPR